MVASQIIIQFTQHKHVNKKSRTTLK